MYRQLPQLHKQPGTALVLSGGATKAFYFHLGVLTALRLEEISSIIGTSAGAMVGAFIAAGAHVDELIASLYQKEVFVPRFNKRVRTFTSTMLFKPDLINLLVQGTQTSLTMMKFLLSLPTIYKRDMLAEILDRLILTQDRVPGLFQAHEIEKLYKTVLPSNNFADTDIDLYITATNLDRRQRAVFNAKYSFNDGRNDFITDIPIYKAVRASTSLPGIFEPARIKNQYYIDGEIKQTLSMDIGLALADRVIISHTYHPLFLSDRSVRDMGWFNVVKQSIHMVLYERIAIWREIYETQFPDKQLIWIEPDAEDVEFFLAPEFSFRPETQKMMVQSGAKAARKALAKFAHDTAQPAAELPVEREIYA